MDGSDCSGGVEVGSKEVDNTRRADFDFGAKIFQTAGNDDP